MATIELPVEIIWEISRHIHDIEDFKNVYFLSKDVYNQLQLGLDAIKEKFLEMYWLNRVRYSGIDLRFAKYQSPEICLVAVRQFAGAFRYAKFQTPQICMAAVSVSGYNLQYVKEQTPEICKAAVLRDPQALEYVRDDTLRLNISSGSRGV